ncbi:trafficking protein particle complex subunit 9 [Skeletonema marinoi]|uniref:Trafficking protein particle complex subunit 9 n=1 Tax=Skeletonema marinoi TaxID=267567 RepID=A0AAD8YAZ1_9STRA|nr:trafficking protein particle complex subunit 9 [Skeletonema marinoi]
MHSQLPGRPSFRDSAIHSVAIVPLTIPSGNENTKNNDGNNASDSADAAAGGPTITTQTYSDKSYSNLLNSLQEFALQGRLSNQRMDSESHFLNANNSEVTSWSDESSQITLILPHSQLTRPGDWRYNTTPLKSHDWQSGSQRIRIFDGRQECSRMAYDRLRISDNDTSNTVEADPWSDLEPHRTTAAIIGVLNMKDCRDTNDLWAAEKSLMEWANRYDTTLNNANSNQRSNNNNNNSDNNGNNIIIRLFVFDSFEESIQQRVNISETRLCHSSQIVAFPPLEMAHSQMMALHWNVVVNDLAVSLFRSVEGKIRRNDLLSKSIASGNTAVGGGAINSGGGGGIGGGIQAAKGGVAALLAPASSDADVSNDDASIATNTTDANTSTGGSSHDGQGQRMMGLGGRFKNAFDNTRKAIANRQDSANASYRSDSASSGGEFGGVGSGGKLTGGNENWNTGVDKKKLVTPLDLDATVEMTTVSARDMEALKRRDLGRREKRSADLSLLAGSPIDAYERYTRAAELTRHSHDPLWYASALEGCACAFIAMAEAGGHGVDEYLENNFQLPEEIMALAIAQGVAAGADLGDSKGKTMTVDRSKTTLPQAVTALVEEALSVLCRHEKLASLHAGLLLKLAEYVQELEEGHLRCRWGEGEFCYGGDLNSSSGDYAPPRWEKTSVSRLTLQGAEVREMLALDSIERGRKFTELLHRAVSVGGLDDRSRADVAAACARACLKGTKTTQWGSSSGSGSPSSRLRFPRKAAYFTLIAAEAMSRCRSVDAGQRASNLYVAASHLYSRKGNEDDSLTKYGWATLRASALQGLSCQPSDKPVAEEATELLVALLNEISPDQVDDSLLMAQMSDGTFQEEVFSVAPVLDRKRSTEETNSGRPQYVSNPLASMAKTPFFSQAPPSALSLSQSKWLEDEPVQHIQLPCFNNVGDRAASELVAADKMFEDRASALTSSLSSLSCVTNKIGFDKCARIQKLCVVNMSDIRQQMGATSSLDNETIGVYEESSAGDSLPPPLVVTSAKIIKSESHLLLERTKAVGYSSKFATHSMSTFFNPYAKNQAAKDAKNKVQTTLLAEGEERTIMIEFKNRLAVPLEVPSCRLEFEGKETSRIEAPPLSFTVPAKTKSFAVHFPFIVSVSKTEHKEEVKEENDTETETVPEADTFDVAGLCVTCLNRTFPIRFKKSEAEEVAIDESTTSCQIPPPASVYQRSTHNAPKQDEQQMVVRLESVPAQPNLLVSFAASQSPMEEDANVPVHLSDGEIFTIPPFRLENDLGKSGMGEIERLQVLAVGLPGIPDETLFDTDALAAALEEEEDVLTESDSEAEEDFEEMMDCDGLPPLKMKVIAAGLDLKSINDKSRNKGEGSIVKFQMAATHDMGDQLANGGNVRIRFRYRGPSPNPATEIWRKREISLRIIRVKGPRISSLTFRSDLSWGSSYSELCNSLAMQRRRLDATPKWESSNNKHRLQSRSRSFGSMDALSIDVTSDAADDSILNRVGMDNGVHVSADEVVLLMAVANETNSTIILSNKKGLVGGFEGSPMPTVKVTSGVSVKIPVVIPRIDRIDENGEMTDIAAELVSRTALQWESEVVEEGDDNTEKIKRTGRVRIPSRCLREIIDEHQSFASRICKPPVSLQVSIGEEAKSEVSLKIGEPVQVKTHVSIQDWVPLDVVEKSKVTLEFCCAEKQPGNNSSTSGRMPYVWCGQLRRTVDLSNDDDDKSHCARIAFFQCGVYVVSACAKVSSHGTPGVEEFWWAPHANIIKVNEEIQ